MAVKVDDGATATIYDVRSIAKDPANLENAYASPTGYKTASDVAVTGRTDGLGAAHGYYADVTGGAPTHTTAATAETSWGNITLAANTAKKLTFTFWLEGADTECFDSCAGQNISFLFDFILASTGA
jgi:hypothetical protein